MKESIWKDPKTEIIPAAAIISFYVLFYTALFIQLEQIPGTLYGGDFYSHYGIINHIYNGNPPWTCPQMQGEYAFYPWLLHLIVAVMAGITGDMFHSYTIYFPFFVMIASGLLIYLLGRELFKEGKFVLLLCFGWMGTRLFVDYIPSYFTPTVLIPLFLLSLVYVFKYPGRWSTIFAGVSFGLLSLSHGTGLPGGTIMLVFLAGYQLYSGKRKTQESLSKKFFETLKVFFPILLLGFAIALLYWGPVLFFYHFDIKNPWPDYTQPDYEKYGIDTAKDILLTYFFNIEALLGGHIEMFIYSGLTTIGFLGALRRGGVESKVIAVTFISGFFGFFHYFFTLSLLNTHYAPERFNSIMISPLALIISIYGIYIVYNKIREKNPRRLILIFSFALLALISLEKLSNDLTSNYTIAGLVPRSPQLQEMEEWVKENTDKNSVFLSNERLSFALNALTGRKLVVERRSHANPYVNMDQRIVDASVMLYGNDSGKRLELLEEYNVTYVYWDSNYMYFIYNQPTLAPLSYEGYLKGKGIKFKKINTYLNAENSSPQFKRYEVLSILPAHENDTEQPWSDGLAKHLILVKEIKVDDKPAYRIYKVDYSSFDCSKENNTLDALDK